MAFTRRRSIRRRRPFSLRRRYYRRRRRFFRRSQRSITRRQLHNGGQLFTRLYQSYVFQSGTGFTVFMAPTLVDFKHFANFAQFWSDIRVWKLAFKIRPCITVNPVITEGSTSTPADVLNVQRHVGAIYYDDAFPGQPNVGVSNTTYTEISQMAHSKSTHLTQPLRFSFVPRVRQRILDTGNNQAGINYMRRPLLDTNSSGAVPLSGLLYSWEGASPEATPFRILVDCYAYVTFYNYRQYIYTQDFLSKMNHDVNTAKVLNM